MPAKLRQKITDHTVDRSLIFLKLGGSLITEKDRPRTPRLQLIRQLIQEVADFLRHHPDLRLVLGHGSGSFGHVPARKYGTRQGVTSPLEWQGFAEVWREARMLNQFVMDALAELGVASISIPPSAGLVSRGGVVHRWNLEPIRAALHAGLLPVVYGDVVFDLKLGGTIFSTEDLFEHLALHLEPKRILLAGIEPGVWLNFPETDSIVREITPTSFPRLVPALGGSSATDVTGGMASKVEQSLRWVQRTPGLEVLIFSGKAKGSILNALNGGNEGTLIRSV